MRCAFYCKWREACSWPFDHHAPNEGFSGNWKRRSIQCNIGRSFPEKIDLHVVAHGNTIAFPFNREGGRLADRSVTNGAVFAAVWYKRFYQAEQFNLLLSVGNSWKNEQKNGCINFHNVEFLFYQNENVRSLNRLAMQLWRYGIRCKSTMCWCVRKCWISLEMFS